MLDRVKTVGEDDSPISKSSLEHWPAILLCPLSRNSGVVLSKLKEVPKQWYTRNFGQILDLWCIRMIQVFDEKEQQAQYEEGEGDR